MPSTQDTHDLPISPPSIHPNPASQLTYLLAAQHHNAPLTTTLTTTPLPPPPFQDPNPQFPPHIIHKMGNLCGKESSPDAFSQPGRTLASAPPANTTSTLPKKVIVGGPARTLGSKGDQSTRSEQSSGTQEDARRRAAEAAEVCLL